MNGFIQSWRRLRRRAAISCIALALVNPLSGALMALLMIGMTAAAEQTVPAFFVARQQFEAEVSEVDRAAKVVRLKTDSGRLTLHTADATPTALKKGDRVLLEVTVIRHSASVTVPRGQENPPPLLSERLRASITSIHRSIGLVALNTSAGRIALDLPSAAIAGLHTGDAVLLELAVHEPSVSALPGADGKRDKRGFAGLLYLLFGRKK